MMNWYNQLTKAYMAAKQITFDDNSKFVLMSDCHRGDGSWADDFSKNQNLYFAALTHYYRERFTYIEIGDGDELWENSKFANIVHLHKDVFYLLSKFYKENRLFMIYGNHDLVKKDQAFVKENYYDFYSEREHKSYPLFQNITPYEAIVLLHRVSGHKIFLVHGHQVDFMNSTLWRLSRFLVKNVWKKLELFGLNDPTSAAKNNDVKKAVEKRLTEWVINEKLMLIAGHTHKPVFPEVGKPLYFNDGSCVHPRGITAIEIMNGQIILVKWQLRTKTDGTLFVGRETIAGPKKLTEFWNQI